MQIIAKPSKHIRQVGLLYVTTIFGVLIGVLNSVINTRSLSPEPYGDVRYVQNIISFISSLLLFGFFTSGSRLLALSKSEEQSRHIRGIMVVLLSIAVFVVMVCMTIFYIVSVMKGTENLSSLWLAAIPCCGSTLMINYINTTAQGDNHIGRISVARLMPSAVYCVLAFFIYRYFGATPVLMLLLHNGIATIILSLIIWSTHPSLKDLKSSFKELREENRTYGFNIYLGSLVTISTSYIAGITLGNFCENNSNVGFYTLALTISHPLATLPAIVGTTFFKRFAKVNCISRKVLTSSVAISALSCILFIAFIHIVVNFLYNESYSSVSTYAKWLAIGTTLHGFGDMLNRFLGAHGQGKQIRNGAFASGITKTIGSFLFVYLWSINGAVFNSILGSVIYFSSMLFYYIKFVKSNNPKE